MDILIKYSTWPPQIGVLYFLSGRIAPVCPVEMKSFRLLVQNNYIDPRTEAVRQTIWIAIPGSEIYY